MKLKKLFNSFSLSFTQLRRTNRIEKLYFKDNLLECASLCNEAINNGTDDFFAHYYLGLVNLKLNLLDESMQNLRTALEIPMNKMSEDAIKRQRNYARCQIAMILRKQRKYEEAIQQVEQNIIVDPNYLDNYSLLAGINVDLDKTTQAMDNINRGLKIDLNDSKLLEFKNSLVYDYSVEQSSKRNSG